MSTLTSLKPPARNKLPARSAAAPRPSGEDRHRKPGAHRGTCACGGHCPQCSGAANLAGNAKADPAPPNSPKPPAFVDEFVRWAQYKSVSGPTWNPKGTQPLFEWGVNFETSLEAGYLVQHVESQWYAENCDGTPYTGQEVNQNFWERWHFENGVNTTARDIGGPADDIWVRNICEPGVIGQPCPLYARDTWGEWVMKGELYVVPGFPPDPNFSSSRTGRSPSGNLERSFVQPTYLRKAFGKRTIGGRWNFCGANTTHTKT